MLKKAFPGGAEVNYLPMRITPRTGDRQINRRFLWMETCLLAILSLALFAAPMFGQASAQLSGAVTDSTAGILPAATITATNTETAQEYNATTNASGFYSFPALPPGVYTVVARMSGFQSKTITDVRLRAASQSNLPFTLEVAGTVTEVSVTSTAESMILEAGSSSGTVMQEELVAELPLVGSNVMELLNSMGGVIKAEEPIFGASNQSFAGINGGSINVTRDGVSANEIRYNSGVTATSYVNPELVGEFRMILSPVDAELGRGAGQVQVTTRSGSNAFHGSGVWNNQNTVLDAGKFEDKRQGLTPPWRNVNNYTLSLSGPIIKNKTFFFASWDQQIVRNKEWTTVAALTDCAKKGIYRYYDGVVSVNPIDAMTNDYSMYETTDYPRRQTVMNVNDGSPKLSSQPAGSSGQLMYQSVFGDLGATTISDINGKCSDYTPPSGVFPNAWDADRNQFDTTGYVSKYLSLMPETNYFGVGDGLNTAGIQWWRTTTGTNNIYGTGEDNRRKQFTVKIDHNLNNEHRLSGTYTIEKNAGEDGGTAWPENSYIGRNWRKPQSLTLALTSTVTPTMLNEFRFGYTRTTGYVMSSIDASDGKLEPILKDLLSGVNLPDYKSDLPIVVSYDALYFGPMLNYDFSPGVNMLISSPFTSRGVMNNTWGGTDNSWMFSDTVTWMKGAHSFKSGVSFRSNQAWYSSDGEGGFLSTSTTTPSIRGGDMNPGLTRNEPQWDWPGIRPSSVFDWDTFTFVSRPGLSSDNSNSNQGATVSNMLNFLAGGVSDVRQYFYIVKDGVNYRWNENHAGETEYITDLRSNEFSAFFKDDWRITSDLTLNLGVRYEYFGVPWNATGMTVALKGGSSAIQGNVGPTWMNWMGLGYSPTNTTYEFVGPGSENSGRRPWNKDMNNFAPHVGFAWQLPWWGRGLTTLRGGYSISYSPINNFDNYKGIIATVAGTTNSYQYASNTDRGYTTLADVGNIVGDRSKLVPPVDVMNPISMMSGGVTIYDENIRTPYTQSINLSLTRQLGSAITLDLRYIGNLTRKQLSGTDLNTPNYMNNGLFQEFQAVRAQGAATPDSQIPNLVAILGPGAGSRLSSQYQVFNLIDYGDGMSQLAQGNYSALASNLARVGSGGPGLPGSELAASSLPNNYINTNPELQNATIIANDGYTNYHSMQAQVTMRPLRGLSFQSTYTWSRNLADAGVGDYNTGARLYYLSGAHRSHSLTTYGSYELPFGARGFLFRDATGAFKKTIEGWGLSWVANVSSGAPASLVGGSSLWGISNLDVVRPDLWDNKGGKVEYKWNSDGTWDHATFYGDRYVKVPDPACATIAPELQDNCSTFRSALALANDPSIIVIQHAAPGTIGNLTPNSLTGPGRWTFDLAMSKSVEFMEGKRIDFRIDAANIFNHATPSGVADTFNHAPRYDVINQPEFGMNADPQTLVNNPLGYIATKAGHRTFQGKVRISF